MQIDTPQIVTDLLIEAADRFIMPRFCALSTHEVEEKGPGDLVTVADVETEAFLSRELPKLLPGSVVVGEEAHAKDPEILSHLENYDAVWLVDPVDGTVNFANGRDVFCVMVALVLHGKTVQSWIYLPTEGKTAVAEKGAGAYWGDSRIHVSAPEAKGDWIGQINLAYFDRKNRDAVKAAGREFGALERLGCAGQDFLRQSLGKRHFALYRRLWSWDHVPGVLLLREAGGYVARFDGGEYRTSDRVQGLLSAPNEQIWQDIRSSLVKYR